MIHYWHYQLSAQEKKVKTGWKFGGALPAVSFDSDLGFQYGALVEFFNYGDRSKYPDYLIILILKFHVLQKEAGFTGLCMNQIILFRELHMTSDLSYLPDQANHFYGFNGYESVFNKDWMDDEICSITEQECSTGLKGTSSGSKTISRENFPEIISNGVQDLHSRILRTVLLILKDLTKERR